MNVRGFVLAVIAGVVAMASYRTIAGTKVGATILGQPVGDPRYGGDPVGVNVYSGTPAPSGHGDATQNVTGTRHSTVGSRNYCPAFAPIANQQNPTRGKRWNGLV